MKKPISKNALLKRLVKLVAPPEMSYSEYILQCASNGVNVSLDDPAYFGWLLKGCQEQDYGIYEKAQDLLVQAIELKYPDFDWSSDKAVECLMDPIIDSMMHGHDLKDFAGRLYKAILMNYRDTEIGNRVYRLNRGFGMTKYCYFRDGDDGTGLEDIIKKMVKEK